MPSRVGIKRRLWWLALAAPLLAGLDRLPTTPLGLAPRLLDEQLQRAFFQLRGSRPTPADPLILAIDADSLELGELLDPSERQASPLWRQMGAWPWPRALQARLAALVLERGAARVLFNIEYGEPSRFGPADDRAFAATLAPWRDQVHLAVRFGVRERGGLEQSRLRLPIHRFGAPGLTTLLQSPWGTVEAVPGQHWIQAQLAEFPPSLPRPLAFLARPAPPPAAPMGLNYPGPAGTMAQVPAWKLLEVPASVWRGRTVLIGVTAPALGDLQETPVGPMGGTEIQAVALANVLENRGLRPLPLWGDGLLLLGWGTLAGLVLRRPASSGRTLQVALALVVVALLAGGALWSAAQLTPAPGGPGAGRRCRWWRPGRRPGPGGRPGAGLSAPGAASARVPHPAARHPAQPGSDLEPGGGQPRPLRGAVQRPGGVHAPERRAGSARSVRLAEPLLRSDG